MVTDFYQSIADETPVSYTHLDIFVSTRDAFSQIKPHRQERSLKETVQLPVEAWKEYMVNDF